MKKVLQRLAALASIILPTICFSQTIVLSTFAPNELASSCEPNLQQLSFPVRIFCSTDSNQTATMQVYVEDSIGNRYNSQLYTIQQSHSSHIDSLSFPINDRGVYQVNCRAWITYGLGDTVFSNTQHLKMLYDPSVCKTVTGRVYEDRNENCVFDSGDSAMQIQNLVITQFYKSANILVDQEGRFTANFQTTSPSTFNIPNYFAAGDGTYLTLNCGIFNGYNLNAQSDTTIDIIYRRGGHSEPQGEFLFANAYPCPNPWLVSFSSLINSNDTNWIGKIHFGDGETYTKKGPSFYTTHEYSNSGTYQPVMEFVFQDTVVTAVCDPVHIAQKCGKVSGRVYRDDDRSCTYDAATDRFLKNVTVHCQIDSTIKTVVTDSVGYYNFDILDSTHYKISLGEFFTSGSAYETCTAFYERDAVEEGLDFSLKIVDSIPDLAVEYWYNNHRPGSNNCTHFRVTNKSAADANTTLKVVLDNREKFASSSPSPSRIVGQTIEWDLTGINYQGNGSILMYALADTNLVVGDTLCRMVDVSEANTEVFVDNNHLKLCIPVRNSYDPNDKTTYINGKDEPISGLTSAQKDLVYRIRFQNTGNDTAHNIYVLDTLDTKLELESFHVLSASHPMNFSISDNRVVRFEFNNIMLPDDKVNEPKSHGELLYSIRRKEMSVGQSVKNTAYIYFDYNTPVITNTTVNTIISPESIGEIQRNELFSMYPNPSRGEVFINLAGDNKNAQLMISDMFGKTVMNRKIQNTSSVNVSDLSNGMYVVTVIADKAFATEKLLIIK